MTNSSEIWCIREWLFLAFDVWATKNRRPLKNFINFFFDEYLTVFSWNLAALFYVSCDVVVDFYFNFFPTHSKIPFQYRCAAVVQTQVRILDDNYTKWNRKHHWIIMKRNRSKKKQQQQQNPFHFPQWALQHPDRIHRCLSARCRSIRSMVVVFFCCFRFRATIECSRLASHEWNSSLSDWSCALLSSLSSFKRFLYFFFAVRCWVAIFPLWWPPELIYELCLIRLHTTPSAKSQSKRVRRKHHA